MHVLLPGDQSTAAGELRESLYNYLPELAIPEIRNNNTTTCQPVTAQLEQKQYHD